MHAAHWAPRWLNRAAIGGSRPSGTVVSAKPAATLGSQVSSNADNCGSTGGFGGSVGSVVGSEVGLVVGVDEGLPLAVGEALGLALSLGFGVGVLPEAFGSYLSTVSEPEVKGLFAVFSVPPVIAKELDATNNSEAVTDPMKTSRDFEFARRFGISIFLNGVSTNLWPSELRARVARMTVGAYIQVSEKSGARAGMKTTRGQ